MTIKQRSAVGRLDDWAMQMTDYTFDLKDLFLDSPETTVLAVARSLEISRNCTHCHELCNDNDPDGHPINNNCNKIIHVACLVHLLAGTVGHQRGECQCFGGDAEDPPGISVRDSGLAAWEFWRNRK
jgi:hypothetical protein